MMLLFLIYSRLDVKQEAPLLSRWLLVLRMLFKKNHQHNKTLRERVRESCHPFKAVWVCFLARDTCTFVSGYFPSAEKNFISIPDFSLVPNIHLNKCKLYISY